MTRGDVPRMGIAHRRQVITCTSGPVVDVPKRATCSGVPQLQFLWVLPGTHYVQPREPKRAPGP
jgi:hypothetical protein